jgi:iron donor protein CyaY
MYHEAGNFAIHILGGNITLQMPCPCHLPPATCPLPFLARPTASRYPVLDMDEQLFKKRCDEAFDLLLRRLQAVGDERGFEVEGGSGKLEVLFEDDDETRFVISPQTPVRQIWISALTTSFKLAWSDAAETFVLEKTGETLMQLMGRILTEQLGSPVTV